jgi:hypothetical protein
MTFAIEKHTYIMIYIVQKRYLKYKFKKMDRAIYNGIFNDETSQRFLRVLIDFGNIGFKELYKKCMPENETYFKKGLERSVNWSVNTILEDVQNIEKIWTDASSLYSQVFINYVKSTRSSKTHKVLVNVPMFPEFCRLFLISLSRLDCVRDGTFFMDDIVKTRVACMDACRDAFFALDVQDNVQLELKSVISSVEPYSSHRGVDEKNALNINDLKTDDDIRTLAESIKPSDSVSQIGRNVSSKDDVSVILSSVNKRLKSPEKKFEDEERSEIRNNSLKETDIKSEVIPDLRDDKRREDDARSEIRRDNRRKEDDSRSEIRDNRRKEDDSRSEIRDNRRKEDDSRSEIRRDNRRREDDARSEIRDNRRKEDDSRSEIRDNRRKEDDSRSEIRDNRRREDDTRSEIRDTRRKEDDARSELRDNRRREDDARSEIRDNRLKDEYSRSEIRDTRRREDDARSELRDNRLKDEYSRSEIRDTRRREDDARSEIRDNRRKEDDARSEIRDSRRKEDDSRSEIRDNRRREDDSRSEIRDNRYKEDEKVKESLGKRTFEYRRDEATGRAEKIYK